MDRLLKKLRRNAVINIKKGRQRALIVIVNLSEKIHEAEVLLENRAHYKPQEAPMVKTIYEKVNEIINRFILLRQKQRWYDIKLASTKKFHHT